MNEMMKSRKERENLNQEWINEIEERTRETYVKTELMQPRKKREKLMSWMK